MHNIPLILQKIVQSFEQMLSGHPDPVYQRLLNVYSKALADYVSNQDPVKLKSQIKWTDRTILEAPGWNRDIGLQILYQITELYSYLPE